MYALGVLHKKLKSACPFIHKKRLTLLILTTQALLTGQRLSLTQLGRSLFSKAKVKHKIKRIDRMLANPHLQQERKSIYQFLSRELLKGNNRPLIIVDWSDLTIERDYHLLRASVPVGGRALTLYEEVHPQKDAANPQVHRQFLLLLQDILPIGCVPIIITDAGFRNPWFKEVLSLGWDYVGRVRNRDMLKSEKGRVWGPCKALYDKATRRPCYLGEYWVVRSNPVKTFLYLVKQKRRGRHWHNLDGSRSTRGKSEKMARRQKEPWLITTSLYGDQKEANKIIKLYKTRMQIEEAFRDTKSHRIGFSISESRTRQQQRLEILLLIGALASFNAWLFGILAELKQWHHQYQSNSNKARRVLSTFFIGCQVAKENRQAVRRKEYELGLSAIRQNAMAQYG